MDSLKQGANSGALVIRKVWGQSTRPSLRVPHTRVTQGRSPNRDVNSGEVNWLFTHRNGPSQRYFKFFFFFKCWDPNSTIGSYWRSGFIGSRHRITFTDLKDITHSGSGSVKPKISRFQWHFHLGLPNSELLCGILPCLISRLRRCLIR